MRYQDEMIPLHLDTEPGGKWMTNLHRTDAETLRRLRDGSAYVLVTGLPKATETRSIDELAAIGMVGVYVTGIRI